MQEKLPAECLLKQTELLEIAAKDFGFAWERLDQLMDQIRSECSEVEDAFQKQNREHLEEEIGDLIHAAISLAVFCQFDPQVTLRKSLEKFRNRFSNVVHLAKKDGFDSLHQQPFDILMSYWDAAKKLSL